MAPAPRTCAERPNEEGNEEGNRQNKKDGRLKIRGGLWHDDDHGEGNPHCCDYKYGKLPPTNSANSNRDRVRPRRWYQWEAAFQTHGCENSSDSNTWDDPVN